MVNGAVEKSGIQETTEAWRSVSGMKWRGPPVPVGVGLLARLLGRTRIESNSQQIATSLSNKQRRK